MAFPQGMNYPDEEKQRQWNIHYYNSIEEFPAGFDRKAHLATIEWGRLERPDAGYGISNPFGLQLAAYISDEWVWEFITPETVKWAQTARTGQAARGQRWFSFAGTIDWLYYPSRHNLVDWQNIGGRGWGPGGVPYYLQRYLFVMTPRTLFGEQALGRYMVLNVVSGTTPDQIDFLNEQLRLWREEDKAAESRHKWNEERRNKR